MKKLLHPFICIFLLSLAGIVSAQTPMFYTQAPVANSTSTNTVPYYYGASGTHAQALYPANIFTSIPGPRYITAIYMVPNTAGSWTYNNIEISLGQPAITALTNTAYASGTKRVFTRTNYTITRVKDAWLKFELDSQFYFDPEKPLVVEVNVSNASTGSWNTHYNNPHISGSFRNYSAAYNTTVPSTASAGTVNLMGFDHIATGNNQASMRAIVAPLNFCTSAQDLKVRIANNSSNVLSQVTVKWTLDGLLQSQYTLNAPLDTFGGTLYSADTVLTIGNIFFGTAGREVRAWVEYPNLVADTINTDDTVQVVLKPGLSGTYTIGGTSPDYASFTAAVNDLNLHGICGPVTFNVAAGTYNERITINQVFGASATNTISFTGAGKGLTTLSYAANSVDDMVTVLLNGTDHIQFRDMTVAATNASYGVGFLLTNDADSNSIRNIEIQMVNTSTTTATAGVAICGSPTDLTSTGNNGDNNVFDSLSINGAYYGMVMYGTSTTVKAQANNVSNCTFTAQNTYGIYSYYHNGFVFGSNTISGGRAATYSGIYNYYASNFRYERNTISSPDIGITTAYANSTLYNSATPTIISNNIIKGGTDDGLYMTNCDYVKVLHNTLISNGTGTTLGAAYFTSSESIDFRNNICVNTSTGAAVYFPATAIFTNLDYNNYYTGGAILANAGSTYANLAAWKTAVSQFNINSFSQLPVFVSATDNHLQKSSPVMRAVNAGINIDIDGEARYNPTIIGADEPARGYNDAGIEKPLAANLYSCAGSQPVMVNLLNDGKNIVSYVTVNWKVNGTAQTPFTWNSAIDTLGSTNGFDTTVAIGSYTFSGTTYDTIKAWTEYPGGIGDTMNYNDTVTFIVKPGFASGTYTVGPGGNYSTLTAAINAISNGLCGPVTLELRSNYVSSSETFPIRIPSGSLSSPVLIRPETGASNLSISGNNTTAVIDLNGTKYVTLDGRAGGSGTNQLTITNSATTAPVIRFINDATNNTLQFINVTGNNTSATTVATSGAILFGTTTGTEGNSNNLIDNCSINGNGTTVNCIFSQGSAAPADNKNNTITNCNIFNFFANVASADIAGIALLAGNSNWTIGTAGNGNRFYQTAARTSTTTPALTNAGFFKAININSSTVGGCSIVGNRIGGNIPGIPGSVFLIGDSTVAVGHKVWMIDNYASSTSNPNTIQDNIISDITVGSSISNSFIGIHARSSAVNMSGNLIGSLTGNGSIYVHYTGTTTNANLYAIRYEAASGLVQNNRMGSMSVSVKNASGGAQLLVIYTTGTMPGPLTITNNIIGGTTQHSIQSTSNSLGSANVMGVCASGANAALFTVSNNLISNLSTLNTSTASTNGLKGIYHTGAATGGSVISGNIVRSLYSVARNASVDQSSAVLGITCNNSSGNHVVSGNRVYALHSAATTGAANVNGIHISGTTTGTIHVSGNLVYGITADPANSLITLAGITTGTTVVAKTSVINNMISLGFDSAGAAHTGSHSISGIYKTGATGVFLHNSVNIGGAGVGAAVINTYAYRATANVAGDSLYNNLFVNTRVNAAGGGSHFAIGLANAVNLSVNRNDYYTTAAPLGLFNGIVQNALSDWKASTAQDANSVSAPVNFTAHNDLHLTAGSIGNFTLAGTPLANVSTDYDNQTRSATYPYMGADENTIPVPVKLTRFTAIAVQHDAHIAWTTASEKNASHFIVEASADGHNFKPVGRVDAKGNSATANSYMFVHADAQRSMQASIVYYRLLSVDNDNSTAISQVAKVDFTGKANSLASAVVYPNPFNKDLTIGISSETQSTASVSITDIQGRLISRETIVLDKGMNEVMIRKLNAVEKGIYLVRIDNEEGSKVIKVVKE